MATNANGESTKGKKKVSAKKRRAKQRARIIIFVAELLIIAAMLVAVLKVFQTTEEVEGPQFAQIDESQIVVNCGPSTSSVVWKTFNTAINITTITNNSTTKIMILARCLARLFFADIFFFPLVLSPFSCLAFVAMTTSPCYPF